MYVVTHLIIYVKRWANQEKEKKMIKLINPPHNTTEEDLFMTQKELLYLEDAISHEENVLSFLNDTISNIDDEKITTFIDEEIKFHESLCSKLMKKLKGLSHE